jgi:phosphoglucomutase/phosphomannomutase
MLACYKIIDVDFPERGFLLFWQLPLDDKLKYFTIEPEIEKLKIISDQKKRQAELFKLISFLGSNPLEKIDTAFKAKHTTSILEYLNIK